jgi:hypothetical protein
VERAALGPPAGAIVPLLITARHAAPMVRVPLCTPGDASAQGPLKAMLA